MRSAAAGGSTAASGDGRGPDPKSLDTIQAAALGAMSPQRARGSHISCKKGARTADAAEAAGLTSAPQHASRRRRVGCSRRHWCGISAWRQGAPDGQSGASPDPPS